MSKDPAVLFYTSDFMSGTYTMSDTHVGMYIRLLCLQHQKGALTEQDMLYICRTHVKDVFDKFDKNGDGLYCNKRMHIEIQKRTAYSESRRKNVSNRYKAKSTYVVHMENENINENIKENNGIKTKVFNIVADLNDVCGTQYKSTGKKTREFIAARLNEGFTEENFKTVHRIKFNEWSKDEKMCKFLRPETLYGNKFESYLNQVQRPGGSGWKRP
jgi:uncharacterized phage protein (TIGR02220 family)